MMMVTAALGYNLLASQAQVFSLASLKVGVASGRAATRMDSSALGAPVLFCSRRKSACVNPFCTKDRKASKPTHKSKAPYLHNRLRAACRSEGPLGMNLFFSELESVYETDGPASF